MKRLRNRFIVGLPVLVALVIGMGGCGSTDSSQETTQAPSLRHLCSDEASFYTHYTACANAYPNGPTEARATGATKPGKE